MKSTLPQRKVHIATFGCQMNEYDSDKMLEILIQSIHSMNDVQPYHREVSELALKSSMKEVKSYKRRVPLLFSTEDNVEDSEEETKKECEGSSQTAPWV